MNREIEKKFKKWKLSTDRKPLIIQGARQIGKTYIIKKLELYYNEKISEHKTLLFFDKIQCNNRALTSLKYFCEDTIGKLKEEQRLTS